MNTTVSNMTEAHTSPPESLAGKLRRIEELAEKLVYIKWSREFFVLLQRVVQDIAALTQSRPECGRIRVLAQRLNQELTECLNSGALPRGARWEQLIMIMDALCRITPPELEASSARSEADAAPSGVIDATPLFSRWDKSTRPKSAIAQLPTEAPPLWLVAPDSAQTLMRKIEQRGHYAPRRLNTLTEAHALLTQAQKPAAILLDLDMAADQQSVLQQAATLRQILPPDIPLFFLAERNDLTARLEAVEAGAAAYFLKPVDLPLLMETLNEWALKPLHHRVLIVEETLAAGRDIARWLNQQGMVTQVLAQPLLLLQTMSSFRPNLLVLNLDFPDLDGLILAQAIRQHEHFRQLPLVLVTAREETRARLAIARLESEILLNKPLNPELLIAAIARRLNYNHDLYRKISQLNKHDSVSGLYNRPYFLAHLERALINAAANTQAVALMLVALDNLREAENRDIAATDEVIEQAAQRLQSVLGPDAIAARFSDAMFMALFGLPHQDTVLTTARAVQASLETEPYQLSSGHFTLATSIGVSTVSSASRTPKEAASLIQQADLARSLAQGDKTSRIHIQHEQSPEQLEDQDRQRRLMEEIREAVQQQRMTLLFQAIVSLRGDTTERYEVLLRMRNHEGWELLPETVFALAKRHRIGMVLDRWVIAHAIRVLRERKGYARPAILFINISPTILQDEELLNWLQAGLTKTGVPASSLVFEMTETAADLNKQALLPFVTRLRELGCGLSLDHFSGHARSRSLVELLQANYVKLSGGFTENLLTDKDRQKQLTDLSRSLAAFGVTSIVTGIEDAKTLPVLWSCGIDYVQGYFLQRPHTEMSYDFENIVV